MDVTGLGGVGVSRVLLKGKNVQLVHVLSWKYVGSSRIAQGS